MIIYIETMSQIIEININGVTKYTQLKYIKDYLYDSVYDMYDNIYNIGINNASEDHEYIQQIASIYKARRISTMKLTAKDIKFIETYVNDIRQLLYLFMNSNDCKELDKYRLSLLNNHDREFIRTGGQIKYDDFYIIINTFYGSILKRVAYTSNFVVIVNGYEYNITSNMDYYCPRRSNMVEMLTIPPMLELYKYICNLEAYQN